MDKGGVTPLVHIILGSIRFAIPSNSAHMSFPPLTCKVLEEYSIRPPKNESLWLGPWLHFDDLIPS
jgi:hypothetical protein